MSPFLDPNDPHYSDTPDVSLHPLEGEKNVRILVSEAELAEALASIPRCQLSLPGDEHHVHQSDAAAIFAALARQQEDRDAR